MTYFANYNKHAALAPHAPDTKVEILGNVISRVEVSPLALEKMNYFIKLCQDEIGWLGIVRQKNDFFLIEDVILFDQEVTAVTTAIDEQSLARITCDILTSDPVNGLETANSLRMWGHSHVNMGAAPSGQDDTQMTVFNTPGVEYFIRAIGNKQGKMRFDIFHYTLGIVMQDVKWSVNIDTDQSLEERIREEIKEKVSRRAFEVKNYLPPLRNNVVSRGVRDDDEFEDYLSYMTTRQNAASSPVVDVEEAYDNWESSYKTWGQGHNSK